MSAIFGERFIFGQQNGPELELMVFGDEFYARYETPSGYTTVYDLDLGQYCYAALEDGYFISSGVSVSQPAPNGIRKHLREHPDVRNRKFNQRYEFFRPPESDFSASSNVMRTFGPNSGLLRGEQLSIGDVRGLTIIVEFQDLHTNVSQEDVHNLLNAQNYSEHGNFCSVNEYYNLMSSGRLNYTNMVVGPVRLSRPQSHYINNLLVREALQLAVNQFNINLADFDSRGRGVVDALSFMYAGRTLFLGDLWPHNSVVHYPMAMRVPIFTPSKVWGVAASISALAPSLMKAAICSAASPTSMIMGSGTAIWKKAAGWGNTA